MRKTNSKLLEAGEQKILLIDDERDVATVIEKFLLMNGYMVSAYTDPSLALAHLGTDPSYDLIVADIAMPRIDGFELAKRAKKISPQTKILLMTSSLSDEWRINFQSSNADGLIEKPVRIMRITDIVQDFLAKSSTDDKAKFVSV